LPHADAAMSPHYHRHLLFDSHSMRLQHIEPPLAAIIYSLSDTPSSPSLRHYAYITLKAAIITAIVTTLAGWLRYY
jgi:hypothetical protein